MAKSRDRVGREQKKQKKDQQAKVLTRSAPHVPMNVEVVPRKRKPREEEEDEE
jgi:hypothetical protein